MILTVDLVRDVLRYALFDGDGNLVKHDHLSFLGWARGMEDILNSCELTGDVQVFVSISAPYLFCIARSYPYDIRVVKESLELELERLLPCRDGVLHVELFPFGRGALLFASLLEEGMAHALEDVGIPVSISAVLPRPFALYNALLENMEGSFLGVEVFKGIATFVIKGGKSASAWEVQTEFLDKEGFFGSLEELLGISFGEGEKIKAYISGDDEDFLSQFSGFVEFWNMERVDPFQDGPPAFGVLKGIFVSSKAF